MLQSRKFRAALIDTIFSVILMWVAYLIDDAELKQLVTSTILAIKVPTASYIIGTAMEDSAEKHARTQSADITDPDAAAELAKKTAAVNTALQLLRDAEVS